MELFDLSGKVALVTGATGRLGSHLSRGLAQAGAEVLLVGRSQAKQADLADSIRAAGGRCEGLPCDFTQPGSVEAMCDAAWKIRGRIDVLVHNAIPDAATGGGGIVDTPSGIWQVQNRVILESAIALFRSLGPRMVSLGGGGSIISVVSSTGITPARGMVAYGMAKGGLMLLTRYAAQEFGPNVRANCLCPGTIDPGDGFADHPIARQMLPRIAAGRFGRGDECVGATVFLASNAASYVSGQVYFVDGGRF